MKKSLVVTTSKIVALGLIFFAPLIYLITLFGGSETTTVEVTTNSMPIVILIIISLLVIVFIAWLGSSTMAAINDHPFGFGGIYMYGAIIGGVSALSLFWLNKLRDLVNYDVSQFLLDLDIYKGSIQYVITFIAAGLVIATAGFIYEKTA
jgi:hypothetical protein